LDLIHAQYLKVVNARNAREQQQGKREGDKWIQSCAILIIII
jgi:hypothetical protein